jgi:hypothetical protein
MLLKMLTLGFKRSNSPENNVLLKKNLNSFIIEKPLAELGAFNIQVEDIEEMDILTGYGIDCCKIPINIQGVAPKAWFCQSTINPNCPGATDTFHSLKTLLESLQEVNSVCGFEKGSLSSCLLFESWAKDGDCIIRQ